MSDRVARRFVEALERLEQQGDVEPMAALYAPDGRCGNLLRPEAFADPDGAREFWTDYRGTFKTISSSFRSVLVAGDRAALEWESRGTTADGQPFRYDGVTVLETDADRITRSRAYFDPAALGRQLHERTA